MARLQKERCAPINLSIAPNLGQHLGSGAEYGAGLLVPSAGGYVHQVGAPSISCSAVCRSQLGPGGMREATARRMLVS